jgi:hypothetical protein
MKCGYSRQTGTTIAIRFEIASNAHFLIVCWNSLLLAFTSYKQGLYNWMNSEINS